MTITMSRRALSIGVTATVVTAPMVHAVPLVDKSWPRSRDLPNKNELMLRGIAPGEHAILRARGVVGLVSDHVQSWPFEENTVLSWHADDAGQIIEERQVRIQVQGPSKIVEITERRQAPIFQMSDAGRTYAQTAQSQNLLLTPRSLSAHEAWQIIDAPEAAVLPAGVEGFRLYRLSETPAGQEHQVYWADRTPARPELAAILAPGALHWRGRGHLTRWQGAPRPSQSHVVA